MDENIFESDSAPDHTMFDDLPTGPEVIGSNTPESEDTVSADAGFPIQAIPGSDNVATATGDPNSDSLRWIKDFANAFGGAVQTGVVRATPDIIGNLLRKMTRTPQPASVTGTISLTMVALIAGGFYLLSKSGE